MGKNVVKDRPVSDFYSDTDDLRTLMLHNDDVNSFDHVIDALISVCRHDSVQAEQCAYITHYKGKCDIKNGGFSELSSMKSALIDRGLSVTID